jgi:hypothetical protein
MIVRNSGYFGFTECPDKTVQSCPNMQPVKFELGYDKDQKINWRVTARQIFLFGGGPVFFENKLGGYDPEKVHLSLMRRLPDYCYDL